MWCETSFMWVLELWVCDLQISKASRILSSIYILLSTSRRALTSLALIRRPCEGSWVMWLGSGENSGQGV